MASANISFRVHHSDDFRRKIAISTRDNSPEHTDCKIDASELSERAAAILLDDSCCPNYRLRYDSVLDQHIRVDSFAPTVGQIESEILRIGDEREASRLRSESIQRERDEKAEDYRIAQQIMLPEIQSLKDSLAEAKAQRDTLARFVSSLDDIDATAMRELVSRVVESQADDSDRVQALLETVEKASPAVNLFSDV